MPHPGLRPWTLVALLILLAGILTPSLSTALAPQPDLAAAPRDTPTLLVPDRFAEWAVGGGFIYWTMPCISGEFGSDGYLRRWPTHGGVKLEIVKVTRGSCTPNLTLENLAADDS